MAPMSSAFFVFSPKNALTQSRYFRGIRNPIGLKCGPTLTSEELLRLLDILDPDNEPGRVTLICRYGVDKIADCLPTHIKAARGSGHPVIFCCDPMHGNTKTSESGVKTRHLGGFLPFKSETQPNQVEADVVIEISKSFEIHSALGSRLDGVHLEMTSEVDSNGFSVTECIGGSMELADEDLNLRYQSFCDPRLNHEQSLDIGSFLLCLRVPR
jgi:3-deoxy-7-phosphoheptulonate synthase